MATSGAFLFLGVAAYLRQEYGFTRSAVPYFVVVRDWWIRQTRLEVVALCMLLILQRVIGVPS